MTVTTTTNSISYTGDGTASALSVPYQFYDADDLVVTERVIATGAETTKALTTDYTVSGGDGATGSVTPTAVVPATVTWTIKRDVTDGLQQTADFVDAGPLPAETLEKAVDLVTMAVQDGKALADRAIKFPATDAAGLTSEVPNSTLRAGKYLAWDASGNVIAASGPTGDSSIPVSAFMESVLDDADAAAVRTTLGLGTAATKAFDTTGGVQAYDADILKADTSDNLTVGFTTDLYDYGNSGTGTQTMRLTDENMQKMTITGSFTLAPPGSGSGVSAILATNDGTGGYSVTTSGWDHVNGDTYNDAASAKNVFTGRCFDGYNVLTIEQVS